jgi:hypothetical protein
VSRACEDIDPCQRPSKSQPQKLGSLDSKLNKREDYVEMFEKLQRKTNHN